MAMFPRLAVLYAEGDFKGYRRLMRRSILWSIVFLTPLGICSAIFPEEIILLFFGQGYVGAAIALPFLIWSGIISFVASFFSNTLMIAGSQRIWFIMEFMVLALLIIIEFLLIPTIGFMGAAVATLAGELCFLGLILSWVTTNSKLRALFFSGDQKEC
jgi:O-antigen/teichoic acid export membrane protein